MKSITRRLYSTYSERDNENLIPTLIKNALNQNITELSDGLQKLDFIYVDDIISAYLKGIDSFKKRSSGHVTYNLGTGQPISIREVVSLLEQLIGYAIPKEWGVQSNYDIPAVYADISKTQADLNWRPNFDIHKGLQKTWEHYKMESGL